MRILLFFLSLLVSVPAAAQDVDGASGAFEEELFPAGARGRYTEEQGQELALREIRGEVINMDYDREDDDLYYGYFIRVPDTSIYEVVINAQTGKVNQIWIEYLDVKAVVPFDTLDRTVLERIAVSAVEQSSSSALKVKPLSVVRTVFNRKLAYSFELEQSVRDYEVIVDAMNGDVLKKRKL